MDDSSRAIIAEAGTTAVLQRPARRWFSRRRKERTFAHCENCGAPLVGPYCAQCGQHAIDYRRSLWRVLVDAADSFLNWDTKFLGTLGVLLTRPWKLTNDFNAGRRVRYVHPLRVYLLASIAFFLIAKLVHLNPADAIRFDPKDRAKLDTSLASLAADPSFTPEQRAKIEQARANVAQATGTTSPEDRERIEDAMRTLVSSSISAKRKPADRAKFNAALERAAETPAANSTPAQTPVPTPASSASPTNSAQTTPDRSPIPNKDEANSRFETWLEARVKAKIGEGGTHLQLFLETLRDNMPTMMLCCIPLFAFVLKALYIRKRRFYVEHLVYALHIHSFAYIAVVLITLLDMGAVRWAGHTAAGLTMKILATIATVQIFISIRRVYRQGWFLSTFKFFLGGVVYFLILVLAVGATAFITLLLPG
ncbi:MAG: DUF3667 domain-containing protein [Verrucomicrobia bacterium]|nr:DUF3667 domain-containing protein [Verrucomicrobiota bacterium]